jgi:hypothetical protein
VRGGLGRERRVLADGDELGEAARAHAHDSTVVARTRTRTSFARGLPVLRRLELAGEASVPERLAPQSAAERAAADATLKWLVLAHDSYAREDRVVATFGTEREALARLRELEAEPDADPMRIVRAEWANR